MLPLLLDEGLPHRVASALSQLGWDVRAVGHDDAPPRSSSDEVNCRWCADRGAILVTNDRGRKDRVILDLLAQHHVHALFIHDDLRAAELHDLARALLNAEKALVDRASRPRGLIHHRLMPTGRINPR